MSSECCQTADPSPRAARGGTGAGFRVLVADDDPGVREVAVKTLRFAGHRVVPAVDGEQAWRHFEGERPDVVVCDIRMPGIDGIALLERIRRLDPTAEVVLITGFADTGLVIDALRRGASNFIEKPFTPTVLLQQLETSFLRRGLAVEAQRLEAELEIERRRTETHQRLATMGRLLAGLAHEINNPLTFLKGNLELVVRMLSSTAEHPAGDRVRMEPAAELLRDAQFGAQRIEELVRALRRFGRPLREEKTRVPLARIMENSLRLAGVQRPEGTQLHLQLPDPEVCVLVAPLDLETCVVNLLSNAFEALQVSGTTVRFYTSLLPYATGLYRGLAEIWVEDDGPGIPKGIIDEVFTPFFTRKRGGTGLGLSIAYEAAKRNGAQLELHSQEENGTRAVVRLPYDVQTPGAEPQPTSRPPARAGELARGRG